MHVHKYILLKYLQTIKEAASPNTKWGPADPKIRAEWLHHKECLRKSREEERNKKGFSIFKQNVYFLIGLSK